MSLAYNILWLDDQPDQNRGAVDHFTMHLQRRGFLPQVEKLTKFDNAATELRARKRSFVPDIILVDYRLGDGHTGDNIAKLVRQIFATTTIIFYSSQPAPELRALIARKGVDGVYCVHRNELKNKGFELIEKTVSKLVDVVQLRGAIIATAAVLDEEIENCIIQIHDQSDEAQRSNQLEDALGALTKASEAQAQSLKGLDRDFKSVVKSRLFNSALKAVFLTKMLQKHDSAEEFEQDIDRLQRYVEEVNQPRNLLAHQVAKQVGSKLVCGSLSLDSSGMDAIRITIGNHQFGIQSIAEKLRERSRLRKSA
jgi:DNA-binding NarL/FixJ family response regulator